MRDKKEREKERTEREGGRQKEGVKERGGDISVVVLRYLPATFRLSPATDKNIRKSHKMIKCPTSENQFEASWQHPLL